MAHLAPVSEWPRAPSGSAVVVPAHDEERVIAATLRTLLGDGGLGEATVVVACNGCQDDTVAVAEATIAELGARAVVISLDTASKVAAIREAEKHCPPGPRLFLDADVECSGATAAALLRAVGPGGASVAVPRRELVLDHAGWAARSYHRFWADLPWVREQLSGRGAYAMSAELREATGPFPDVLADDRWATTRCPREAATVVDHPVLVRPASRLRDVVAVRTRVYAGNADAAVPAHDVGLREQLRVVVGRVRRPRQWAGTVLFVGVSVIAGLRGRLAAARRTTAWGRDHARGRAVPQATAAARR